MGLAGMLVRTAAVSTAVAGEGGSCPDAGARVRTAAVSAAARGRGRQRSRCRRAGEDSDGSGLDGGARARTAAVSTAARSEDGSGTSGLEACGPRWQQSRSSIFASISSVFLQSPDSGRGGRSGLLDKKYDQ